MECLTQSKSYFTNIVQTTAIYNIVPCMDMILVLIRMVLLKCNIVLQEYNQLKTHYEGRGIYFSHEYSSCFVWYEYLMDAMPFN